MIVTSSFFNFYDLSDRGSIEFLNYSPLNLWYPYFTDRGQFDLNSRFAAKRSRNPPVSRQPSRRTIMGIRMRLHEGEPIGQALRRFKKLVELHKKRGKRHKPTPWWYEPHFVRNTEIRRRKEFMKWVKSRDATFLAERGGKQPSPYV